MSFFLYWSWRPVYYFNLLQSAWKQPLAWVLTSIFKFDWTKTQLRVILDLWAITILSQLLALSISELQCECCKATECLLPCFGALKTLLPVLTQASYFVAVMLIVTIKRNSLIPLTVVTTNQIFKIIFVIYWVVYKLYWLYKLCQSVSLC